MVKIVPSHPHLIADYQDDILASLDDEDMSIRMRALELTCSMVSKADGNTSSLIDHYAGQPEKHS